MNRKGQIFSLDLLMSLVVAVLALGLLVQAMEINAYETKEQSLNEELKIIGETAADLLVSNPNIVCALIDNVANEITLDSLPNCLVLCSPPCPPADPQGEAIGFWKNRKDKTVIMKEDLGIPTGYDCMIDIDYDGSERVASQCADEEPPSDIKNVYSAQRNVVVYTNSDNPLVPKTELYICIADPADPNCHLVEGTVTLKVWKDTL